MASEIAAIKSTIIAHQQIIFDHIFSRRECFIRHFVHFMRASWTKRRMYDYILRSTNAMFSHSRNAMTKEGKSRKLFNFCAAANVILFRYACPAAEYVCHVMSCFVVDFFSIFYRNALSYIGVNKNLLREN